MACAINSRHTGAGGNQEYVLQRPCPKNPIGCVPNSLRIVHNPFARRQRRELGEDSVPEGEPPIHSSGVYMP